MQPSKQHSTQTSTQHNAPLLAKCSCSNLRHKSQVQHSNLRIKLKTQVQEVPRRKIKLQVQRSTHHKDQFKVMLNAQNFAQDQG